LACNMEDKIRLPKGRRTKQLNQAISMIIEMGIMSMSQSNGYDYDDEEEFTFEDIEVAYLLILNKMFPNVQRSTGVIE